MESFGFPSFLTKGSRASVRTMKTEPRKMILRYSRAKVRAGPLAPRRLIEVSQKTSPPTVKMAPARRLKGKALCTMSRAPFVFPFPSSSAVRLDEPIPISTPTAIIAI